MDRKKKRKLFIFKIYIIISLIPIIPTGSFFKSSIISVFNQLQFYQIYLLKNNLFLINDINSLYKK